MLEVRDLRVDYGAAPALRDVSIAIETGELVCVVGPNGAGKTTLIDTIAGLLPARAGRIAMDGRDLTGLAPHRFCDAGIALVPEGRRLFSGMTVRENLELGGYRSAARPARARTLEAICARFPALSDRLDRVAGTLSGGQQQMVAIGRALMALPRLLLLDEPSLGLAPVLVAELFRIVRQMNKDEGLTVLIVEQNAHLALEAAHAGYVLEAGRVVLAGTSEELQADDSIRRSYLGY